ncbi:pyridoxamine 5'-phosphate oxidase family protein [Synechocystis sp. PCC 7339]|uniref:pyridoxamine 5'-phosphate oxidase family protein n=1 Tax=unclassified Synechocystis TaxID=2640012 RepID=UPI001BB071F1|nr:MULTISPECIES: pyridoxamine 5'-phosphate oxidase family protein [unclassified Synechocystis]QUS59556.1 pyridoxamine 5'-phosphate oxidase family protein [Synechocystis sp. PCC 7338]UAJ71742.1 pyridoxamine 5'-phosphate oxidase family protein [Synechocystis sp. PCC 7339]
MAIPGWQRTDSPFHQGERAIQERLGALDQMDNFGRRIIREFLPEQHRQFYAQLSYFLVGTVDAAGNPWASILVGEPGFISTPNDHTLHIAAQPLYGDPLTKTLKVGSYIGFLGVELHTRRRNRVNGMVSNIGPDGFEVQVSQTFGNCPKYIQARQFNLVIFDPAVAKPLHTLTTLGETERQIVLAADTFFITTAYLDDAAGMGKGVDVSHRGGKPGFVRVDGDTLTVPDFIGNCHFNTFGNIEVNPRAGLLFIDFDRGNLLYLTGRAEVVWDGDPEIEAYAGAERLFKFHLTQGIRIDSGLPLAWSQPEYSRFLEQTGFW